MDLLPNQVLVTFTTPEQAEQFTREFVNESDGLIMAQEPSYGCSCCDNGTVASVYRVEKITVYKKEE